MICKADAGLYHIISVIAIIIFIGIGIFNMIVMSNSTSLHVAERKVRYTYGGAALHLKHCAPIQCVAKPDMQTGMMQLWSQGRDTSWETLSSSPARSLRIPSCNWSMLPIPVVATALGALNHSR